MGVWKRSLSEEEVIALAQEMSPPFVPISFDIPEGWATKPVPTQTMQGSLTGNLALEQDATFRQTFNGRSVNVAEITGDDGTAHQIFGVNDLNHGSYTTPLERDVWLMVSGGNHDVIVGGSENNWENGHATPLRGDIAVELGAKATANNIIGAVYKGGHVESGAVKGNVLLTIKGTVKGALVGGILSAHNLIPVITGNTRVRVLAVQSTNENAALGVGNRILGGSAYMVNTHSGASHIGDTMVEVILPSEAGGTFVKEIAGGSYASTASYAITGNTSVSISAPDTVTFSQPIYGGSVSNTSTATISGDTSVTLNGGTYANRVCAGGYGSNAGVEGKATLTLRGGVFTKSLEVSAENAPVGSSELIIDGGETGIDLSRATVSKDFGALTLKSNLNLGANRLPNATFTMEGERTLTIAVTEEEIDTRRVVLGRAESVPEGLTIAASGLPEGETWSLTIASGLLCYAPGKQTLTWKTPESGTAWEDGFPGFQAGDSVIFGENDGQATVSFSNDVRVGTMTVAGDYLLEGFALSADEITVSEGAKLSVDAPKMEIRYLRLTPSGAKGTGDNVYPGLAELILTKQGEPVAWPQGTTILQKNANGSTTAANWAKNEPTPNALIDGTYGNSTGAPSYLNPEDGSTGAYTEPSGSLRISYNKWWTMGQAGAAAEIALGAPVVFDGYIVWTTDHTPRSPRAWTLEVSEDGETWVVADRRTFVESEIPSANAAYNQGKPFDLTPTLKIVGGLEVSGTLSGKCTVEGAVSFVEGSTLQVSDDGPLTITGAVSGSAKLDLSAWGELTDATVRPILCAPEGLLLTNVPSLYTVRYVDGTYWLARTLTPPFSLALGEEAEWTQAAWQDAAAVAVAPKQWDILPVEEISTSVTLTANATLTLDSARTLTALSVEPSEHTLTLSGAKLSTQTLTLESALNTSTDTLSFKTATLDQDATFTLRQAQNGTLPTISGTGTYVKTGTGTLSIVPDAEPNGVSFRIEEGTVSFWKYGNDTIAYDKAYFMEVADGAIVDIGNGASSHQVKLSNPDSVFVLEGGATLRFSNGAYAGSDYGNFAPAIRLRGTTAEKPAILAGSYGGAFVKVNGTISPSEGNSKAYLRLTRAYEDNPWAIPGTITGDIHVLVDTTKSLTISGNSDYTGGTDIRTNLKVASANALGHGPISIASDATLTIAANTTLNVYGALSGLGTITGPTVDEVATACALHLAEGASLDVSEATAEACLTLNGTLTAAGTIAVTLPQDVTSTRRLLAWASAPEGVTFEAAEATPTAPTARLVAKADGLYYEFLILAEGAQATFEGLSEAAQRQLAAAAFTAGAASVAEISGTTAKRPLTTAEIDAALLCFGGVLTATVSESAATLTVTYDFGIADMAYDREAGVLTVTAKVQGAEGAQTVTFVAGSTVELLAEDEVVATVAIDETGTSEIQLSISKEATATLLEAPRPLKVRVKK